MRRIPIVLACLLLFTGAVSAKKLIPLDIEKGQIFDDVTEMVDVSLSEENVGEKATTSIKAFFPAEGGWAGLWMPKKSAWEGFKTLTCSVFNASSAPVKISFVIKDLHHAGGASGRGNEGWEMRKTWCVIPYDLKPGMNEVKIELAGIKTQEGKPVNFSRIFHWGFYYKFFPELKWEEKSKEGLTLFISKLKLEE